VPKMAGGMKDPPDLFKLMMHKVNA
jgi:hypothetical protein